MRCLKGEAASSSNNAVKEYACKVCKRSQEATAYRLEDRKLLILGGRSEELVCMDCVPPKEFAKHAGKEFTCQKCGPVVFEKICVVDQRRIALEKRFDRITRVECRPSQKKECAPELTCRQCHTPKPLCDYAETVEETVAHTRKTFEDVSSKMVCQSCKDAQTHRVCSECDVREPRDEMACKKGTNRITDRCTDCAFPLCAPGRAYRQERYESMLLRNINEHEIMENI